LPKTVTDRSLPTRNLRLFLVSKFFTSMASQLVVVAVGWQIYQLTGRLLDLGLIGLSQFLPFIVLSLFAGHAADRYDRRRIILACNVVHGVCAVTLLALVGTEAGSAWLIFATLSLLGIARAFHAPASQALLPNLVAPSGFARAVALNSSSWQVSTVAGPALAGLLYAMAEHGHGIASGAGIVYTVATLFLIIALALMVCVVAPTNELAGSSESLSDMLEGLRFVWQRKPVLGAISLDLFAVLFGGATALLPAFTRDVLHAGPDIFGYLRTAPGVGAAVMAVVLAFRPIARRVGFWMFAGVAIFGIATIAFGLTHHFWVALGCLVALGAGDMISVFIRHILVQMETPDAIRGRVSAVNSIFIGASNELGEFESGLTASWFGLVPSIVIGGALTLLVTVLWAGRFFPMLWRLGQFGQLQRPTSP
jgi:MFS family permease